MLTMDNKHIFINYFRGSVYSTTYTFCIYIYTVPRSTKLSNVSGEPLQKAAVLKFVEV